MNVSPISAIKIYSDNLLVQSLLIKTSNKTSNQVVDLTSKLLTREDSKDISSMAENLSTLNSQLKNTGNEKAVEGLKYVAKHFASNPKGFDSFVKSINNLDNTSFQNLFSTMDKLGDKGLNVDKWIDTFSSISDTSQQNNLLSVTNQILNDKSGTSSQKDTLNQLISTINKVQNGDYEDKSSKLSSLFTSVAKSKSLTDMKAVIGVFNKNLT